MTKRELIDRITDLNPTAQPAFLAGFEDADLAEYLEHLEWVSPPDRVASAGPAQPTLFDAPTQQQAADAPLSAQ